MRPGDRIPPATGPIYYITRRGVLFAAAKPRKRGRGGSAKQLSQQEWFKQAARAVRYMDPEQIHVAKKLTQGFPIFWRDYLMQNLAGRFGVLQLEDGRQIHSLSEQQDVSDSLDAIGQATGDILYRSSAGWRVLAPGADGRALTTHGPGVVPDWQPSGGAWALQEAVDFVDATEYDWLNLLPNFEYEWVIQDISTTGVDRQMLARISLDGGASFKTSGYRGMLRWQSDTAGLGNRTSTSQILLGVEIGNSDDQTMAGVLSCVCDLGLSNTRKQFTGYSTTYLQTGKFYVARYASSYQASKAPINALKTFINGSEFSGRIALWRRGL